MHLVSSESVVCNTNSADYFVSYVSEGFSDSCGSDRVKNAVTKDSGSEGVTVQLSFINLPLTILMLF